MNLIENPKKVLIYTEIAQIATYVVSLTIDSNFGPHNELLSGIQVLVPFFLFFIFPLLYLSIRFIVAFLFNSESAFNKTIFGLYCLMLLIDIFVIGGTIQTSFF
jgi:hypothetical protein